MRSRMLSTTVLAALSLIPGVLGELKIDFTKPDTIRAAAKIVAQSLVADYKDQEPPVPPGTFRQYKFFEAGQFFNTLIDYAAYTGDNQFNDLIQQDFFAQIGSGANFIPANQSSLTNDDVGYWALAAVTAAEYNATSGNPDHPTYLQLADNVFNNFVNRWDEDTCSGGLRWNIFPGSPGYDAKDTGSNGAFFQLSARLGLLTKNETYLDWADKIYDWTAKRGLISTAQDVYASTTVQTGCREVEMTQFSGPQGLFLYGSAAMANATKSRTWSDRVLGSASSAGAAYFGPQPYVDDGYSQVVFELVCEKNGDGCTSDEKAGKNVLFRALGSADVLDGSGVVWGVNEARIKNSARAAAKSCSEDGQCSFVWTNLQYDSSAGSGVGEKMAVLEAFFAVLKNINPMPNTQVFQTIAEDNGRNAPAPSASGDAASQTGEAPAETNTNAPSSASRVVAGGLLGVVSFVSFLLL